MFQLLLILHVLIAVALVVLVLLQQGKGAEVGASFGAGASQTIFGSQGSSSFLMKITGLIALVFFVTSLALGYFTAHQNKKPDLIQQLNNAPAIPATGAPAAPAQQNQNLPPVEKKAVTIPAAGVPIPQSDNNKK